MEATTNCKFHPFDKEVEFITWTIKTVLHCQKARDVLELRRLSSQRKMVCRVCVVCLLLDASLSCLGVIFDTEPVGPAGVLRCVTSSSANRV